MASSSLEWSNSIISRLHESFSASALVIIFDSLSAEFSSWSFLRESFTAFDTIGGRSSAIIFSLAVKAPKISSMEGGRLEVVAGGGAGGVWC